MYKLLPPRLFFFHGPQTGKGGRIILAQQVEGFLLAMAKAARIASVSVGFGSKERPGNGIFDFLPARKMARELKKIEFII